MAGLLRFYWILLPLLVLQACSGITVSQDYDQAFDFSGLKTFSWKPNIDHEWGLIDNDLVDRRIRSAIESNLAATGHQQIDSGQPDFYISYHMTVEQKISTSNVSTGVSIGRSSHGTFGGIGVGIGSGGSVRAYEQGTLLIDVTGVSSGELIWRGISTQIVSDHSNPEKTTENVNATVEKMLQQFPPK